MSTATQPEAPATESQYSYKNPPPGFYFDHDEVKGDRGQKTLGTRPLLSITENEEGVRGAIAFYGYEGFARFYNGTSGRVAMQGIARRISEKGMKEGWSDEKINEEIAKAELASRPGKRQGGQSTAQSRAVNAAKKAAGKVSGDAISSVLERVAAMSDAERAAFASTMGLDPAIFAKPVENGQVEESEEEEGEQTEGTE